MPQKVLSGAERKERAVAAFFFAAAHNRPKDAFGKRVRKVEYKREPSSGYLHPVKATAYVDDILVMENTDPMSMDYELKYHNELTPTGIEGRTETSSGNTAYYIKDHLGSVRTVVDDQGQLVEATMYDAYGKQYVQAYGPERFKERFSGKEFDEDGAYPEYNIEGIGLNYFGFRYYNPVIAIWTTVDPEEEFYSPFTYCSNNPTRFIDPDGKYMTEHDDRRDDKYRGARDLERAQDKNDIARALEKADIRGDRLGFEKGYEGMKELRIALYYEESITTQGRKKIMQYFDEMRLKTPGMGNTYLNIKDFGPENKKEMLDFLKSSSDDAILSIGGHAFFNVGGKIKPEGVYYTQGENPETDFLSPVTFDEIESAMEMYDKKVFLDACYIEKTIPLGQDFYPHIQAVPGTHEAINIGKTTIDFFFGANKKIKNR